MSAYTTIEAPARGEIEIKKSRFIAQVAPVETEEEALADARYNAINWIQLELEDTNDLPPHTVQADVHLAPGEKYIDMMIIMPREGWDE